MFGQLSTWLNRKPEWQNQGASERFLTLSWGSTLFQRKLTIILASDQNHRQRIEDSSAPKASVMVNCCVAAISLVCALQTFVNAQTTIEISVWFRRGSTNMNATTTDLEILILMSNFKNLLVPLKGLEPPTPSLRMTCSTS